MVDWEERKSSKGLIFISSDGSLSIEQEFGTYGNWVLRYKGFTSIISWPDHVSAKLALKKRKRIPFRRLNQIEVFDVGG